MDRDDSIFNIYMALRSGLARVVMRIVPPREVEDIVQETYVRVCQIDKSDREIGEPRAFMYRTARNLALDYLKRAETRLVTSAEDSPEALVEAWAQQIDETFEKAASDEEFSLFCKAVRELPLQCRRVFVLKKVYGYSQREIAKQLNISENTVETQIAVGIKRCTYFMQQYDKTYRKGGRNQKRAPAVSGGAASDRAMSGSATGVTAAGGERHE